MIREVLKTIVLSDYNAKFQINGRVLFGSVLYTDVKEPTKFVMLCRSGGVKTIYSIHRFDKNYRELECEEFNNFVDFANAVNSDGLRYNQGMNESVLEECKEIYLRLNANKYLV